MNKSNRKNKFNIILTVISCILISIGIISVFTCKWYQVTYTATGFDSIIITLFGNNNGAEEGIIYSYLLNGLLPAIIVSAVLCILLFRKSKSKVTMIFFDKFKIKLLPISRLAALIGSVILCVVLIVFSLWAIGFFDYIEYSRQSSTIFEDEYADASQVKITFPENKKNLVYIFLESVESTFFSEQEGGSLEVNCIPELYELASQNINFSHNDGIGGFNNITGATWTIGAMVSQSSGIPLKLPTDITGFDLAKFSNIIPGATTLSDILHENGYYQALMVGSDSSFGGRNTYYLQHNADKIYDYYTAIEDGIIPEDYHVWWGMEDKYLFEYAKNELTKISQNDTPFAFTMLTVDTHFPNGYVCEYCSATHDEQYENVYACSSKQIYEFIEWLKQQPYYENTTVVIAGDHPTMDQTFIEGNGIDYGSRKVYNCFMNSSVSPVNNKNRAFTAFDMFPSTLAAMGCTIEGERLGLGVNLFSELPTLTEKYGISALDSEIRKYSYFYNKNIHMGL